MMDSAEFMKICMKAMFGITIVGIIVAYIVNPNAREQITAGVEEQKQLKAEARFFMPDINTGEGAIIVDRETGVCYYWRKYMNAGGMTVLVNADGKPVIWEDNYEDEE